MNTTATIKQDTRTITITVVDTYNEIMELEVTSDNPATGYGHVKDAITSWLEEEGSDWTVDSDISRVGVGVTADGQGMGHAAKFHASISDAGKYKKAVGLISQATSQPTAVVDVFQQFRAVVESMDVVEFADTHDYLIRLGDDLEEHAPELMRNHEMLMDHMLEVWKGRQPAV